MKWKLIFFLLVVLVIGIATVKYLFVTDISLKTVIFHPNEDGKVQIREKRPYYHIKAKVDIQHQKLTAAENLTFFNRYPNTLHEIVLHLYPDFYNKAKMNEKNTNERVYGDIFIENVEVSGQKTTYSQKNQILAITLPKGLPPHAQLQIKINFVVKIPMGNQRLNVHKDNYSITKWYPILAVYDPISKKWDKNPFHPIGESDYSVFSDYDVEVQVPKKMTVVATGMETENKRRKEKIVKIKASNVREFAFFMSPHYKVISKKVLGTKINLYVEVENQKEEKLVAKLFGVVEKSFSFFSNRFGTYPYPEFDLVETGIEGLNMEYPTIVQMGKIVPDIEGHLVHELAHQWFYGLVASDSFHEPALDESLAQFATKYYFEKNDNKNGLMSYFKLGQNPIVHDSKPINRPVDQFPSNFVYQFIVYKRGALVLYDLYQKVGESKMNEILHQYVAKNRYTNASFDSFFQSVQQVAGTKMREYIRRAFLKPDYYPQHLIHLRK